MSIQRPDNVSIQNHANTAQTSLEHTECSVTSSKKEVGFFSSICSWFSGKSMSSSQETNKRQVAELPKQVSAVINKLKAEISAIDSDMKKAPMAGQNFLKLQKENRENKIKNLQDIAKNSQKALSDFKKDLNTLSPADHSSIDRFIGMDISILNEAFPELVAAQREAILDALCNENISPEKRAFLSMGLDIHNMAISQDPIVVKESIDSLALTAQDMALGEMNALTQAITTATDDMKKLKEPQKIAQKMSIIEQGRENRTKIMDSLSKFAGIANETCRKNPSISKLGFNPDIILSDKFGRLGALNGNINKTYDKFAENPSPHNLSNFLHGNLELNHTVKSVPTTEQAAAIAKSEGGPIQSSYAKEREDLTTMSNNYATKLSEKLTTSALNNNTTIDAFIDATSYAFSGLKTGDKALMATEKRIVDEFLTRNITREQKAQLQILSGLYDLGLHEETGNKVKALDEIRRATISFSGVILDSLNKSSYTLGQMSIARQNNEFMVEIAKTINSIMPDANSPSNSINDIKYGKLTGVITTQAVTRLQMLLKELVSYEKEGKEAFVAKSKYLLSELTNMAKKGPIADKLMSIKTDILMKTGIDHTSSNSGAVSFAEVNFMIQDIYSLKLETQGELDMFNNHLATLQSIRKDIGAEILMNASMTIQIISAGGKGSVTEMLNLKTKPNPAELKFEDIPKYIQELKSLIKPIGTTKSDVSSDKMTEAERNRMYEQNELKLRNKKCADLIAELQEVMKRIPSGNAITTNF